MQKLNLDPDTLVSGNIICPDCGAQNWLSAKVVNGVRLFHCQCGNWFCASPRAPIHVQKRLMAAKVAGLFWSRPLGKHKQAISDIFQLISADGQDLYLLGKLDHLLVQKLADSIYENELVDEQIAAEKQLQFSRTIQLDFAFVATQFFSQKDRDKHLPYQGNDRDEYLCLEQSTYVCPCCESSDVQVQLAHELNAIIFSCPVCNAKACLNTTKELFVGDYIFSMLASGLTKLLIPEDGGENAELLSELFGEDIGDIVAWARLIVEQALREELYLTASIDAFYLEIGVGEIYRKTVGLTAEAPQKAQRQTLTGLLLSFFGIKEKRY